MKAKKYIYWVIGLVLVVVIIYFGFFYKKNASSTPTPSPAADKKNNSGSGTSSTGKNPIFPIKKGDVGEHVQRLQKGLNLISTEVKRDATKALKEDGNFGTNTENRLLSMYGYKTVDVDLATKIAKDAGIPLASMFVNLI